MSQYTKVIATPDGGKTVMMSPDEAIAFREFQLAEEQKPPTFLELKPVIQAMIMELPSEVRRALGPDIFTAMNHAEAGDIEVFLLILKDMKSEIPEVQAVISQIKQLFRVEE